MHTAEIHPCATAGCREWTMYRHCAAHESDCERHLHHDLDRAALRVIRTEEAWLAALADDRPLAVVETEEAYRTAVRRLDTLQNMLGVVA